MKYERLNQWLQVSAIIGTVLGLLKDHSRRARVLRLAVNPAR